MLTEADLFNPFDDYHVMADGLMAFRLEHRREAFGSHPRTFRHFHQSLGGTQGRFFHPLRIKVRSNFFQDPRIVFRYFINVGLCHIIASIVLFQGNLSMPRRC